eukprot:2020939-Prymnesium_polylepis.1
MEGVVYELLSDTAVVEAMIRQRAYALDCSVKPRERDEKTKHPSMYRKLIVAQGQKVLPLAKEDWELIVPYNQWVGSGFMALDGPPDQKTFEQASKDFFSRQRTVRMYFAVDEVFYTGDEADVKNTEYDLNTVQSNPAQLKNVIYIPEALEGKNVYEYGG